MIQNAFVQIRARCQYCRQFKYQKNSLVRKRSRVRFASWAPCLTLCNNKGYPSHLLLKYENGYVPISPAFSRANLRAFVINSCKKNISADADQSAFCQLSVGQKLPHCIGVARKNTSQTLEGAGQWWPTGPEPRGAGNGRRSIRPPSSMEDKQAGVLGLFAKQCVLGNWHVDQDHCLPPFITSTKPTGESVRATSGGSHGQKVHRHK